MAGITDMNVVLSQGNVIKEVHNVRKQTLELNQQFVAQKTEDEKNEEKAKVPEFDTRNKIEIKGDEEKKNKGGSENSQRGSKKKESREEPDLSEGSLIDIKV